MHLKNRNNIEAQLKSPMSQRAHVDRPQDLQESPLFDDDTDIFDGVLMPITRSSTPDIKDEPDDWFTAPPTESLFATMANMQHDQSQVVSGSIDPSDLFLFHQSNNPNPMTNSFSMGNSGIADEELTSLNLKQDENTVRQMAFQQQSNNMRGMFSPMNQAGTNQQMMQNSQQNMHGMSGANNNNMGPLPQQSMFNLYNAMSMPEKPTAGMMSPPRPRPSITQKRSSIAEIRNRRFSDSRPPASPRVSAVKFPADQYGNPVSPTQPINTPALGHRGSRTLSSQWGSPRDSIASFDSPPHASPVFTPNHNQISEVLQASRSNRSLNETAASAAQTQEAKRRRRRESHNLVERRRRDNINERIQDLSQLVPDHRLEDERVRKYMLNNSTLSPLLGATSLNSPTNASGSTRRMPSISNIAPPGLEDKDKGPNKGDILNGSVTWMRDLMWYLHIKIQQESEMQELVAQMGHPWPFHESDEERRMKSELLESMEKNGTEAFEYSRRTGTSLRVPGYTDYAGNAILESSSEPEVMLGTSAQGRAHGDSNDISALRHALQQNGGQQMMHGNPYWSEQPNTQQFDSYNTFNMEI